MLRSLFWVAILWSVIGCSEDIDDTTPDPVNPNRCIEGMAGAYPCSGYDLLSVIDNEVLGGPGASGNDSWGWVDPATQKEYALIGMSTGTAFIEVTNPLQPVFLGRLPTATESSIWRDIKVYQNHAFIVSEAVGHGMQVFDLTRLREVNSPPETFNSDAHYTQFGKAHNVYINESSGYAYAVGSDTYSGGPHFVNIQNPTNPQPAGGYAIDAYSHDVQVINYNGPDQDYIGKEILIGSNENELVVVDVTDKANPVNISSVSYPNIGYTHQGWFTVDNKYFIVGDELDEVNFGNNTRTLVFNVEDLDAPTYSFEHLGPTAAIDHNGYVHNGIYYLANYTRGVTMLDVSNIANGELTEVGYFDTYPANDGPSSNGVWNIYPFLPSGNIIVSDIDAGFFMIQKSN